AEGIADFVVRQDQVDRQQESLVVVRRQVRQINNSKPVLFRRRTKFVTIRDRDQGDRLREAVQIQGQKIGKGFLQVQALPFGQIGLPAGAAAQDEHFVFLLVLSQQFRAAPGFVPRSQGDWQRRLNAKGNAPAILHRARLIQGTGKDDR